MMVRPDAGRWVHALAAIAGALGLAGCGQADTDLVSAPTLVRVTRGPLSVTVREGGEVTAHRMVNVSSEVEGRDNTLIFLIPEGTIVKEGDKIAEIDTGDLADRRAEQEIKLERARAALVQAKQTLEIQLKEIVASEQTARSRLRIAELAYEKFMGRPATTGEVRGRNSDMIRELGTLVEGTLYEGLVAKVQALLPGEELQQAEMGDMAQQVLRQIDQVRLAGSDLKIKESTLEYSKRLFDKTYITRSEYDKDRLDHESQLSKTYLAMNELDLLVSYTLKRDFIRLSESVKNSQLELEKVLATNKARRAREEAEYRSSEAEFTLAKERFENLVKQIDGAIICAPVSGLVIYSRMGGMGRDVVEEGMNVHERQTLVQIPDFSRMVVTVLVQEASINKVAVGQSARISVDAFPDRPFTGKVTRVAPLPDSGSRWMNNELRVYQTTVSIDGVSEDLRPGMSASVEIDVGTIPDALLVPVTAVQVQGVVPYVWKRTATGPQAVPVKLGSASLTHTEVREGLAEGDELYLTPPPGVAEPTLVQPKVDLPALVEGVAPGGAPRAADASAELSREERRQLMTEIREALTKKFPDRAELKEQRGWFRLLRDPEIQSALESDPDLSGKWAKLQSSMGSMMGGPGGGPGGPPGEGGGRPRPEGQEGRPRGNRGAGARDNRGGEGGREPRD